MTGVSHTVAMKARRYLVEGRLQIDLVAGGIVRARCRGDDVYLLGFDGERWSCSCPALRRCAHLAALELVVAQGSTA